MSTARILAACGMSHMRIGEALGVSDQTVILWRHKYPEFDAACEPSLEEQRRIVSRSAFQRAIGYEYRSEKIMLVNGEVVRVPTIEHCPPDPTSFKYWLNNRDRENWSEKTEVEQSGGVTVKVVGGLPSDEEEEK